VECHFGADETGGAGDEGFHRSEVFDRINRIYRIYRAGAKRRQPEAIYGIGEPELRRRPAGYGGTRGWGLSGIGWKGISSGNSVENGPALTGCTKSALLQVGVGKHGRPQIGRHSCSSALLLP